MNLVPLFEEALEFQNYNGTVLSNGKAAVYYIGRTRLADIYNDVAAEYPAENPRILDNLGMGPVYVNPAFDYELVVFDAYDNELFSVKKYIHSKGEHSTANVVVTPSESIAVSAWTVGDVQVYMPYLTGHLGKVYTGIEPIVVNNTEDKISANHVPLGVQDPLYFVQDDEEGCIIGFSGQTIPEGVMSESGLGFENDKITGYNGSAFSAGNEYEAGSYVDITDNTISVTGLQPEGDYAYNSALSSKLDVTATGQFLTGLPEDLMYSGDMTAYQPAGDYQTAGDYLSASDSANFLLTSDSGNFYPMEGNPSGFLTAHQSLDDYATKQWVEDKGYITGIDIAESANWNEATTVVNNNSAIWNNTTNVVSSNSAAWGSATPQIPVTGINGIKISESGDKVVFEVSGDYYPGNNPSGFITGVDLSDYATTAQLAEKQDSLNYGYHDTAISSIDESALYDTSAHARINTLAGRISDLSSNKLDTSAFSDVSGTFLTAHQDLSNYQTTAGMTAYQPSGDYLTTADSANFYTTANESGFITGVDLTPYQLTADMTAYQPVGDYMTTADSANFYTTANESGYISEVPAGTMNESAFGYDANDKISGYNGSAFAGGSDVPEGVMVESGLEYNAVNQISGYNGSAIAQYGHEAQWLVHDDTLVHASNSAQYALGVNLSAVAQLLGVDETVLYSGTSTITTATLSEPATNFNRLRVTFYEHPTETAPYQGGQLVSELDINECLAGNNLRSACMGIAWHNIAQTYAAGMRLGICYLTDPTTISSYHVEKQMNSTAAANNIGNMWVTKVVGIGRKQ